ncbi:hypothetical protein [Dongia sp.]|uniref:hypothetical protein n=1 Tax=Dongia sp. TaxID=1977262 RepID=UPI0035B2E80B
MTDFPTIASAPSPTLRGGALAPTAGSGGIPGNALRPGAIDQSQFQEMLQAQYRVQQQGKQLPLKSQPERGLSLADYRKLAGTDNGTPYQPPAASPPAAAPPSNALMPADGIPTLSAEQFAALTGMPLPDEPSPPAVPPAVPVNAGGIPLTTAPAEVDPEKSAIPAVPETSPAAQVAETPAEVPVETPAEGAAAEAADGVPATSDGEVAEPKDDGRTVWLDTIPDREEQRQIAASGKTWRMKETPGARELFLGPDGEFGWDDFVDIINPLQHIPVVAQIYRAVTGDEAYGLSNFIGAIPFGPLSIASAVGDTVIRAQTGRDAGTDLAARVLGVDNRTPEEANLHLVTQPEAAHAADDTASLSTGGDQTQVETAQVQTAQVQTAQVPEVPTAWTREAMGIERG